MLNQTDSLISSTNSLSQLVQNMFSDNNNNIMLAAIVSLLLVILFVLLLHVYAKWFLARAELQSRAHRRRAPVTISGVPFPSNFHHINIEPAPFSTKGLDSTIVSMIPTFVREETTADEKEEELECVICLSDIEKGEIGRRLPICGHAFHVECIDMWLSSHCNCPICRASIFQNDSQFCLGGGGGGSGDSSGGGDGGVVEIVIGDTTQNNENSESDSVSSVSETSLSLLKRMLSKVFVSSHNNVNELDGSQ